MPGTYWYLTFQDSQLKATTSDATHETKPMYRSEEKKKRRKKRKNGGNTKRSEEKKQTYVIGYYGDSPVEYPCDNVTAFFPLFSLFLALIWQPYKPGMPDMSLSKKQLSELMAGELVSASTKIAAPLSVYGAIRIT